MHLRRITLFCKRARISSEQSNFTSYNLKLCISKRISRAAAECIRASPTIHTTQPAVVGARRPKHPALVYTYIQMGWLSHKIILYYRHQIYVYIPFFLAYISPSTHVHTFTVRCIYTKKGYVRVVKYSREICCCCICGRTHRYTNATIHLMHARTTSEPTRTYNQ